LIEIGSKTAEKNSAQTNRQTNRHYENNGHLAVNQKSEHLTKSKHTNFQAGKTIRQLVRKMITRGQNVCYLCQKNLKIF